MILYGSLILGILLVLLGKLNKTYPQPDFQWSIFWKNNLFSLLMNLVAGLALVLNQKELVAILTKIFPNNPFVAGGLFSFILGISGLVIVQFLVDAMNPKKKTVIGVGK